MAENTNTISQIQVGDVTYDICDVTARSYTPPTELELDSACTAYDSNGTPKYARDGHVISV